MTEPVFLHLDEVFAIHSDQVREYGGAPGVRDLALFQSAVAMAQASFDGVFLHGTIEEMAAAYLFHIVQNHPFIDGNKRAGLIAMLTFLAMNDRWIDAPQQGLLELVLAVAEGKRGKPDAAVFIKAHARKY